MTILIATTAALAACTLSQDGTATPGSAGTPSAECRPPSADNWRPAATPDDRTRLRTWRAAWIEALGQVQARGQLATVRSEGVLLEPDRALGTDPVPPPGAYRCRTIKLGVRDESRPVVATQPVLPCTLTSDNGLTRLTQADGVQRVNGTIYRDTDARGIFLGALALTDEPTPLDYGADAARDMAGIVERVADRRWRIVLPRPAFESTLDVIEITPAP